MKAPVVSLLAKSGPRVTTINYNQMNAQLNISYSPCKTIPNPLSLQPQSIKKSAHDSTSHGDDATSQELYSNQNKVHLPPAILKQWPDSISPLWDPKEESDNPVRVPLKSFQSSYKSVWPRTSTLGDEPSLQTENPWPFECDCTSTWISYMEKS